MRLLQVLDALGGGVLLTACAPSNPDRHDSFCDQRACCCISIVFCVAREAPSLPQNDSPKETVGHLQRGDNRSWARLAVELSFDNSRPFQAPLLEAHGRSPASQLAYSTAYQRWHNSALLCVNPL